MAQETNLGYCQNHFVDLCQVGQRPKHHAANLARLRNAARAREEVERDVAQESAVDVRAALVDFGSRRSDDKLGKESSHCMSVLALLAIGFSSVSPASFTKMSEHGVKALYDCVAMVHHIIETEPVQAMKNFVDEQAAKQLAGIAKLPYC